MSTTYAEDFDTGEIEIPLEVGDNTVNIPPFTISPPDLRRPEATGEIPVVQPDARPPSMLRRVDFDYLSGDDGLDILGPPAISRTLENVGAGLEHLPRHAYLRPAASRRGRGRHRYPSLLVRAWRRMAGAL